LLKHQERKFEPVTRTTTEPICRPDSRYLRAATMSCNSNVQPMTGRVPRASMLPLSRSSISTDRSTIPCRRRVFHYPSSSSPCAGGEHAGTLDWRTGSRNPATVDALFRGGKAASSIRAQVSTGNRTRAILRGAAGVNNTQPVDEAFPGSKCSTAVRWQRAVPSLVFRGCADVRPQPERFVSWRETQRPAHTDSTRAVTTASYAHEEPREVFGGPTSESQQPRPTESRRTAIPSMWRVHSPDEGAAMIRARACCCSAYPTSGTPG
jgi:hypothetical protein